MNVTGKKPSKNSKGKGDQAEFGGGRVVWFNPKPDVSDVEWLESPDRNHAEDFVALVEGLRGDERLSVKLDVQSGRWLAVMFVLPSAVGGPTHALSVRGATAFDACVLLHYFHYVKFPDGWSTDEAEYSGKYG